MIIPFFVAALVIAADQISKHIIKTSMALGESFSLVKYLLDIHYIENEGASFGMLKNHRWIFMSLSSVAILLMLAAIVYLGQKNIKKQNLFINITLATMFGGGAGNMIDRLSNNSVAFGMEGTKVVVDFLEFPFFRFFTFNLADAFVCVGSVFFCLCVFLGKYRLKPPQEPQEEQLP
ncbi:MAG: signal peptidase II [Oscillospiraceae bacterium]|nr:signal peptidase II [Oscillospiraceae bacterium]